MKKYFQIQQKSDALFKDRGSKFFAYTYLITDAEDISGILEQLRPKHKNANHFCFAFQIGTGDSAQIRANDDGEPAGSAGLPILNQIKSAGLTDVLVIVAREFGGTKLGVSGLINAYKTAAQEALEKAGKVRKISYRTFELKFGFEIHGEIMSLLSRYQMELKEQDFGKDIRFVIQVQEEKLDDSVALFEVFGEKIKVKVPA